MTGVHQILAAAAAGDAITNSALELRDLLRRAGPSEVYARHIAPEMESEVRRLGAYPPRSTGGVIIYHASIGEPLVHAFLLSRREPVVLVYHNVTPSKYFERWDPAFAELLDLGRSELYELQRRVAVAVADSSFNASELTEMGYDRVRIIPPIIDPYRLARLAPNAATLHHLDQGLAAPFFLYVGQLLPHKRPDVLVKAMHMATTYLDLEALLMFVGPSRLPPYSEVITEMIRELNLATVHLVGAVSNEDLAAFYTRARAVVTASEHEGFCVPIVEAMAFGDPVIARSCGAVCETLGDGGLLLPPDAGPSLFAEAITAVLDDDNLHKDLAARATARVRDFEPETAQAELFSVLLEVL